jgi:hypothetical protein
MALTICLFRVLLVSVLELAQLIVNIVAIEDFIR